MCGLLTPTPTTPKSSAEARTLSTNRTQHPTVSSAGTALGRSRPVRRAGRSLRLCKHDGMATKKGLATRRTDASVKEFLARVPDERRREDAGRLCAIMQEITGEPAAMWGTSI